MSNLWGNIQTNNSKQPLDYIQEQALILESITEDQLSCVVRYNQDNYIMIIDLEIIHNHLLNKILRVEHKRAALYPITMYDHINQKITRSTNMSEFLFNLESVLSSAKIHNIIERGITLCQDQNDQR